MSNKKKIIVICSMVVLLIAAGYINVLLNNANNDGKTVDPKAASVSYFTEYRDGRVSTRAQEFAYLDAILADEDSSDESKLTAETMRIDLIESIETEMVLENLIKAKGYEEAVVSLTTNKINVIVKDAELESDEVAQIYAIIAQQTGASPVNVIINHYPL